MLNDGYIARLLNMPRQILTPIVLFFSLTGVYLISFNTFDIQMMVIFAVIALILKLLSFPMAPMILGFILGGMMEDNLRRTLMISDGSLSFLWERPITLTIMSVAVAVLLVPAVQALRSRLKAVASPA
ncbi:tripartite tricarboxylate transporter permease [Endozoicomonas gorgoniicola]|uniref:tripartite tricarboxylate transporter permease n=1 Tax=Endozoicomonas gorgoniicola TaxID=1234144 RepID=UPI002AD55B25|nr:tripartite tricarboxylate transporter permease [Endozoicomonas gorgoniicola]